MASPLKKYLYATATLNDSASAEPMITISTIDPDRVGDRVIPEGGEFKNFLKNPILCWVHDHNGIPIGTVTQLSIEPGLGIKAAWRWLEGDVFADRVKNAWNQGVIRAASIGFQPIAMSPNQKGMDIERWELLELTLCPIPMNPDCVRQLKSLGLLDSTEPDPVKPKPIDITVDVNAEPLRKELDGMRAELDAVLKRGRVLSAVNESRLRAAVAALGEASTTVAEVLAQLQSDEPEPVTELAGAPDGMRLSFGDDDDDAIVCKFIDDRPSEPVIRLDKADLKSAIAEMVAAQFAKVDQTITDTVRDALNTATGRVS